MATINTYCTPQDVIDRLSEAGVLFSADPTGDHSIGDAPIAAAVQRGLEEAGRQIDRALQTSWIGPLPLVQDAAALNPHLRGWAIRLAAFHVASNGGRGVPTVVKEACDEARAELEKVQNRKLRIPGLVYPGDGWQTLRRGMGRPRVVNRN